jgi:hypothetical protein
MRDEAYLVAHAAKCPNQPVDYSLDAAVAGRWNWNFWISRK